MRFQVTTRYQIYTEDLNLPGDIQWIVGNYFQAYTVHRGNEGVWRSASEQSMTIEILDTQDNFLPSVGVRTSEDAVELIAVEICKRFGQEAALVVRDTVQTALVP